MTILSRVVRQPWVQLAERLGLDISTMTELSEVRSGGERSADAGRNGVKCKPLRETRLPSLWVGLQLYLCFAKSKKHIGHTHTPLKIARSYCSESIF